ncbi:MAG: hypothetical protein ACTSVM_03630 [Candidatus Ranarchaeia archaeon]
MRKPRLRLTHVRLQAPPRPNMLSLFILTLIFLAVIFGGGVFMWLNADKSWMTTMLTIKGVDTAIWPGLDRQLLLEGLAAMVFIAGGFLGQIIVYEASKYAYKRSQAQRLLVIGWSITIAAYIGLWWMLAMKFQLAQR